MKGIPESEWGRPEHASKLKVLKEAAESSPAYKAALADYLGNSLAPFMDLPEADREFRLDGDPSVAHGYVWLFHQR